MVIKGLNDFVNLAKAKTGQRVAVAGYDEEAAEALQRAHKELNVEFVVFDWQKDHSDYVPEGGTFILCSSPEESAFMAAKSVSDGDCSIVMKGFVSTSTFLKAILDKTLTLKGKGLMSHLALFEVPSYHKLIGVTDGGMIIAPTLADKVKIIENAVEFFRSFEYSTVKIAALCAEERPNPDMPCTLDAASLKVMAQRGQFGKDVILDGPLAFDLAYSSRAAEIKGVKSDVTGDADVFLVPDIEAGNLLGKSFSHACFGKMAGLILGANCPVVLPSRSDTDENKFFSLAAALALSGGVR
ncbi:phosphate acyltransferase [Coprothermobacter platensis]|uniref:phosphate acyltransferase n=1 Tax=Coprothermobacter platensis TaxID=108819 RepID=UPI000377D616|nr:phosphate acyltransferase [Coprothermobacter platensis]